MKNWSRVAASGMDVNARLRWVLDNKVGHMGRFPALEALTGIPQPTWKKLVYCQRNACPETLAALARLKPELATWLLTGKHITTPQQNPELNFNPDPK